MANILSQAAVSAIIFYVVLIPLMDFPMSRAETATFIPGSPPQLGDCPYPCHPTPFGVTPPTQSSPPPAPAVDVVPPPAPAVDVVPPPLKVSPPPPTPILPYYPFYYRDPVARGISSARSIKVSSAELLGLVLLVSLLLSFWLI